MKKRLLSVALVMLLVFSLFPFTASAAEIVDSGTCGDNVTWTLDSDGLLKISGTGAIRDYNTDFSWSDSPFNNNTFIKTVLIEDGITRIGKATFVYCCNLERVIAPESLTSIGDNAFSYCHRLESVVLPQYMDYIGYQAFISCYDLKSLTIPEGVKRIEDETFHSCSSITSIIIPDSVTSIGNYAFSGNNSLTSLTIPDSVTSIGTSAFSGNSSLTNVELPESVTRIGKYAFAECSGLKSIDIPSAVQSLDEYTFKDCISLENIRGIENVSVSDYCFSGCSKLTTVSTGKSGIYAFYACSSLKHATINGEVGANAFSGCSSLSSAIVIGSVGSNAFSNCASLEEITAGSAESNAFNGCIGLKHAVIFGSAGNGAFKDCIALEQVSVGGSLSEYAFSGCTALTRVIMESGTTIDAYALGNCPALTEVFLPATLQTVNTNAFRNSNALTDVYFAGSRTQWDAISISATGNDPLLNANIHLNADIHSTCTHPNTVLSGVQEATCSEPGYTGDEVCTICGETVSKGKSIPALDHSWTEWVTMVPASETRVGYKVRVCANCGETETSVIPKVVTTNPFTDVSADSPFHDAILWAYSHDPQITTGTSATEFSPSKACTRGQVVTFLWRAAGKPEPASTSNPFRDVSSSSSFYKAILWAAEQGITSGTSAGTFSPNETCTRGQVVTFLWRFEGRPEPSSLNNPFTDVSSGSSFFKAILWAAEQGITTGKTPTTFNPTGECTRAHVVTFLYRDMA